MEAAMEAASEAGTDAGEGGPPVTPLPVTPRQLHKSSKRLLPNTVPS